MSYPMVLITNNPAFSSISHRDLDIINVEGAPYNVLIKGRDKMHLGWKLLNHPLYGNFRPYHQAFRTLLLRAPEEDCNFSIDESSLFMLENAIKIYESCSDRWLTPENAPKGMYDDGSVLDYDLMKETLRKAGILQ